MSGVQATQRDSQGVSMKDRELRSQIRTLHLAAQHDKEDLTRLGSNKLQEMLEKAESLQQQVEKPREQALDSELFQHLSEVGLEFAKKLVNGTQGITALDVVRRLRMHYVRVLDASEAVTDDPDAFDWQQMGSDVRHMFHSAPGVGCMLGPLDSRPKERKVAQRRAPKQPVGAAVNPDELERIEDSEKQETDRNMEEMWRVMKAAGGKVPMAELVCNPRSFSQTVENLFTLSFLVRDSRVRYDMDEQLGVMVTLTNRQRPAGGEQAQGAQQDGAGERQQFVVSFGFPEWEQMVQVVRAEECLMPHRQPGAAAKKRAREAQRAAPTQAGEEDGAAEAAAQPAEHRVKREEGGDDIEEDQENQAPRVMQDGATKKRHKKLKKRG